jgi:non-specific serine/threonine protein kinase
MSRLSLYLLGSPRIEKGDAPVEISRRKPIALLAYLAVAGKSHSRDALAALLWPEYDQNRARADLRRTLSLINRTLGEGWLKVEGETVGLNRGHGFWLDVDQFHRHLSEPQAHGHLASEACPDCAKPLSEAVELYQGDFLSGFSLKDSASFDDWQFMEAQSLRSEVTGALERLVRCHKEQGKLEAAVQYARRWLEVDRSSEESHRHLMELYARTGRRAAALRQYEECVRVLEKELRDRPQEETTQLYKAIKENRWQMADSKWQIANSRWQMEDKPSAISHKPSAISHQLRENLPRQLTSFIGREREIAEIKRLLKTTYLLTLTGSGGCGKTRLALKVAADLIDEYADGVWLMDLSPLSEPSLVPQTVASALGLREQPRRSLKETLSDYLRSKQMLLMLDNCEHLVGACAALSESLLRSCQNLRVLATSRAALGIAGELAYRVPSLSLPDPKYVQSIGASDLTRYEAVRLFVERAASSQPTFALTNQNALVAAQICQRLDGIPLAIELAAARVKVLSAEQIADRLDDRFRLLTGGSRTALPRHQTLRATMDWSYNLLSEVERALLRRLSVFAGGWTLEAAEAICADVAGVSLSVSPLGPSIRPDEILDLLAHLVDKSLVVVEDRGGEARYRLLETVRQYGREKLIESGEEAVLRGRHLNWVLARAERAEPELRGPDQGVWLDRLDVEHDNLRSALEWSLGGGEGETGLRLAGALWRFWWGHGYWNEGRKWLEGALSKSGSASVSLKTKALLGAGRLAVLQGDYGQAKAFYEESLSLYRKLQDKEGIASSCFSLGIVAQRQSDYRRAMMLWEESLAMFRELGNKRYIALSLTSLGQIAEVQGDYSLANALHEESLASSRKLSNKWDIVYPLGGLVSVALHQGDYKRAEELCEEILALKRELGSKEGDGYLLSNLGLALLRHQGDYERAAKLCEEALTRSREIGEKEAIVRSLHHLGVVAWHQGDYSRAEKLYREGLAISWEIGDRLDIAWCLEGLAAVAETQGQPERAARIYGMAEALRQAIGAPLPPSECPDYDRSISAVRARLGEEAFKAVWEEGRKMILEEAIQLAVGGGQ